MCLLEGRTVGPSKAPPCARNSDPSTIYKDLDIDMMLQVRQRQAHTRSWLHGHCRHVGTYACMYACMYM